MTALRLGSLFDGIGVFPLAAVRCGIEPVWASEIEKAPISITKRHFPDMAHLGDVTKLDGREIPPVHITGTTMKRPGFQKMLTAIEAGYISAVFVKDLSRLGRNYIEVGKLTEKFFLLHDIRLVAVSDGVDSDEGEDDFTPFKNIMKNISHLGKVSNDFSLFGRF